MYKIDGFDVYEAFGLLVASGSDDFLKLPTRKDPPSVDWPGDLTEFDLSEPAFHPKKAVLFGHIHADDDTDFWNKWQALWLLLSAPGERIIEVEELVQSYKVFYQDQPVSKRLTAIKDAVNIGYEISLQFLVIDFATGFEPGSNGGFVEIKNQTGDLVALIQAPGEYEVIEFSGIQDDGSGVYTNSIIDNL